MRLVIVEWWDAAHIANEWQFLEGIVNSIKRPALVKSVGWVIKEEENFILLAPHIQMGGEDWGEADQVSGVMLITLASINRLFEIDVQSLNDSDI